MWYVAEQLVAVIAITVIVTQIIYPTIVGTRMFPLLRRRKWANRATEAREILAQQALEAKARELESKAYYEPEAPSTGSSTSEGEEPLR